MSHSLQGLNILVTGGFGVLGLALADVLLERGARVALLDRADAPDNLSEGAELLALGGVDLTSPESTQQAVEHVLGRFAGIDALVNVAGGFVWETMEQGSVETWDRMYQMNLRTAVVTSQAVLPSLVRAGRGGRIVNIGALGAIKAGAGMGAYAASKAGVAKLTEALAEELKDQGVVVNAVLPSIIDTAANRASMPEADFTRWVSPLALADVVAFLLSDEARVITGACLPVNGRV